MVKKLTLRNGRIIMVKESSSDIDHQKRVSAENFVLRLADESKPIFIKRDDILMMEDIDESKR